MTYLCSLIHPLYQPLHGLGRFVLAEQQVGGTRFAVYPP
jgi:hypothetical protein